MSIKATIWHADKRTKACVIDFHAGKGDCNRSFKVMRMERRRRTSSSPRSKRTGKRGQEVISTSTKIFAGAWRKRSMLRRSLRQEKTERITKPTNSIFHTSELIHQLSKMIPVQYVHQKPTAVYTAGFLTNTSYEISWYKNILDWHTYMYCTSEHWATLLLHHQL